MLQYILTRSDRYSVAELAQMAIEAGCMWISLHLPDMDDAAVREAVAPDVVDMCREASVFLTVDDRPALARDLGLHGVRLGARFFIDNPAMSPAALREDLGPEAVIGVETADVSALPALAAADIDFATLPAGFPREARKAFVDAAAAAGNTVPVVAEGDFDAAGVLEAMADGCSGVAVGLTITDAPDPVAAAEAIINALASL